MKITIEPTQGQTTRDNSTTKVVIEGRIDDSNPKEILDIVRIALIAWGVDPAYLTHI